MFPITILISDRWQLKETKAHSPAATSTVERRGLKLGTHITESSKELSMLTRLGGPGNQVAWVSLPMQTAALKVCSVPRGWGWKQAKERETSLSLLASLVTALANSNYKHPKVVVCVCVRERE